MDLNGEYQNAFDGLDPSIGVRRFSVVPRPESDGVAQLRVPFWLWNYREWAAFCGASGKSQAPVLRQALHLLRSSNTQAFPRGTVRIIAGRRTVRAHKVSEDKDACKQVFEVLAAVKDACDELTLASSTPLTAVPALQALLDKTLKARLNPPGDNYRYKFDVVPLSVSEESSLNLAMDAALAELRVPVGEGGSRRVRAAGLRTRSRRSAAVLGPGANVRVPGQPSSLA